MRTLINLETQVKGILTGANRGVSVSLTGQTASISTTDILTPSADGLFEISVAQLVTIAGSAGNVKTEIGWTDEQGAQTRVIATDIDPDRRRITGWRSGSSPSKDDCPHHLHRDRDRCGWISGI